MTSLPHSITVFIIILFSFNVKIIFTGNDNEGEVEDEGAQEREIKRDIAFAFIKLVNGARVKWLNEQGWKTRVVRYVDKDVTPQNVLMVGVRE